MFQALSRVAEFVGEADVQGRLYHLGNYPGMVSTDEGKRVRGEVYEITADHWQETIQQLDRYEGCSESDPPPHEYRRELVQAHLDSGEHVSAWAYVLNRATDGLSEIPSGDFLSARSN